MQDGEQAKRDLCYRPKIGMSSDEKHKWNSQSSESKDGGGRYNM